jgi:Coenzyme PQQ synthesis protein D (PqqD)
MADVTIPPGARLEAGDDVTWQEIEGEIVLLKFDGVEYFRLNEVGTRVWPHLIEGGSIDAAVAALVDVYDVDAETLRADVDDLAASLVAAGLLRVT